VTVGLSVDPGRRVKRRVKTLLLKRVNEWYNSFTIYLRMSQSGYFSLSQLLQVNVLTFRLFAVSQ